MCERLLVKEQHLFVSDANHVIVKYASVDCIRILADEKSFAWIELMQAADRLRGGERLPGRESPGNPDRTCVATIDEQFDARLSVCPRQACVIGGTFVGERRKRAAAHDARNAIGREKSRGGSTMSSELRSIDEIG